MHASLRQNLQTTRKNTGGKNRVQRVHRLVPRVCWSYPESSESPRVSLRTESCSASHLDRPLPSRSLSLFPPPRLGSCLRNRFPLFSRKQIGRASCRERAPTARA